MTEGNEDNPITPLSKAIEDMQQGIQLSLSNLTKINFGELVLRTLNTYKQEYMERIREGLIGFAELIKNSIQNIDFEKLSEAVKRIYVQWEETLQPFDTELWVIDSDLFDYMMENSPEDVEITPKTFPVSEYVESHLTDYLAFFDREPLFERHRLILQDAYAAYSQGNYRLSIFPLMATADSIVESTFQGYKIPDLPKNVQRKKHPTYFKVMKYAKNQEDELALWSLFARRVFNVYAILFRKFDPASARINRHGVMHGLCDYNNVTKTDALRLFQFIKASVLMNDIEFEE